MLLFCFQFQKTDACALELQNFESQVAKLRGYGERFQLPVTLIQEAYKLEVRTQYSFYLWSKV
mgnify:CR=1 FL=1